MNLVPGAESEQLAEALKQKTQRVSKSLSLESDHESGGHWRVTQERILSAEELTMIKIMV